MIYAKKALRLGLALCNLLLALGMFVRVSKSARRAIYLSVAAYGFWHYYLVAIFAVAVYKIGGVV